MQLKTSPLAPNASPELPAINGVTLAAAGFGLRYQNRPDMWLAICCEGTVAAGVFTQSTSAAAPVDWCRHVLATAAPKALLVNAGQANCFVGEAGDDLIHSAAETMANITGISANELLVASTGVIGEAVPKQPFLNALPVLHERLCDNDWHAAAEAICTTDTFVKKATRSVQLGDVTITLNGIAKGSGMIAPNMATMLGFVFTDAAISQPALQQLLSQSNAKSFNCISVDGDASTNDTVLAFATGKAGNTPIDALDTPQAQAFCAVFDELMLELALMIARDGEGAQKLITVQVEGAQSDASAHKIAMDVANSPLVKTAIAGEDANWGRIVMAVGKSGEPIDKHAISIGFGEHVIAKNGAAVPHFNEAPVAAYMKGQEITISVSVGHGQGSAQVYSCDLTHGYIDINADYRS